MTQAAALEGWRPAGLGLPMGTAGQGQGPYRPSPAAGQDDPEPQTGPGDATHLSPGARLQGGRAHVRVLRLPGPGHDR